MEALKKLISLVSHYYRDSQNGELLLEKKKLLVNYFSQYVKYQQQIEELDDELEIIERIEIDETDEKYFSAEVGIKTKIKLLYIFR